MPQITLNESVPVKLDGSGNGTARLGPPGHGVIWNPSVISVKVSTNNNEAQCKIYAGSDTTDSNFADGTFSGSSGDSTDKVNGPIWLGNYVWAVWTGGDPGAQATLSVAGTATIP